MNPQSSSNQFADQVLSNGAYKTVALIAAIILWLTVLGRKEITSTVEVSVHLVIPVNMTAVYDTSTKIKIRVLGRRKAIKDFSEIKEPLTISLKDRGAGVYSVPLTLSDMQVPVGLRILSIKPRLLQVQLNSKD